MGIELYASIYGKQKPTQLSHIIYSDVQMIKKHDTAKSVRAD